MHQQKILVAFADFLQIKKIFPIIFISIILSHNIYIYMQKVAFVFIKSKTEIKTKEP